MPVIITKPSGTISKSYHLVPAPLVSFSKQTFNNIGRPGLGVEYNVTLQGQLIPTHGNPFYVSPADSNSSGTGLLSTEAWTKTAVVESQEVKNVTELDRLNSTIQKQSLLRWLFSNPVESGVAKPIKVQIVGFPEGSNTGNDPGIYFYGFVDDITFDSDGGWARPTSYSVNMRTNSFLKSSSITNGSSSQAMFPDSYNENVQSGYMISSLTENFDLQEDGRTTISWSNNSSINKFLEPKNTFKVYTISRSVTAVGSPVYDSSGNYVSGLEPWQHASGYIFSYLGTGLAPLGSGSGFLFATSGLEYGTGWKSINNQHETGIKASNFSYQETVDKEAGTYSINETYTVFSGGYPVIETININQDIGEDGITNFSVQGTIEGLNTAVPSASGNAYENADLYFSGVVDTGFYSGINGHITQPYLYARGMLNIDNSPRWLHPVALSRSVARDINKGVISYTYNFNDRFPNVVSGSINESIQINDTYPGELFSVTPVIGRSQPVLQYLNSRSEYKRSLSINLTMPPNRSLYDSLARESIINNSGILGSDQVLLMKNYLINKKPSITNVTDLNYIFQAANPVNDDNFNVKSGKCYHSAPTETWDPKTGNYSYNIEWTYERE
jgi:hypothetical protein